MAGHFVIVCESCGTVLAQCRCPSQDKPREARGLCAACQRQRDTDQGRTAQAIVTGLLLAALACAPGCHPKVTLALPQADSAEILAWRAHITQRVNDLPRRVQALEEQQPHVEEE
jgi:hypothetical protein